MKIIAILSFLVLSAAAIWMGGLNQDEGWYLYAANLVAEGRVPYRDFFYTQGPLMPIIYSIFTDVWYNWGLLGARIFTWAIGGVSLLFSAVLAARLSPNRRSLSALIVFLLLGSNLYHLYYTSIPKTYALASLFVAAGFYVLSFAIFDSDANEETVDSADENAENDAENAENAGKSVSVRRRAAVAAFFAGALLSFAAGVRISLGAIPAVVGFALLFRRRKHGLAFLWFGIGGALALMLVYGTLLLNDSTREGLFAAQRYHAARGGFDIVFTIGSFSRLVRWYLPVFMVLAIGAFSYFRHAKTQDKVTAIDRAANPSSISGEVRETLYLMLGSFAAVFVVQMLAPFPYEDYQVPIMPLLAVVAAVTFSAIRLTDTFIWQQLLVAGLVFGSAFGSPLLEKWMINGQDRFWSLKKNKCELAQLRDIAATIERLDPGGRMLLTQDLYLAIETRRRVPEGLEMGPFAMLSDVEWRTLLEMCNCEIAALSGYTFAIEPPVCNERDIATQIEYFSILKRHYKILMKEDAFGQNATTLIILRHI